MDLSVFFVGTGGSAPTAHRGLPATLVNAGGDRILFDCGEGTQQQLMRSIGLPEIDAIFVTHLHLDHWLGLVGMLKTFDLRGRETPISVYGPPGLERLIESIKSAYGRIIFPCEFVDLVPHEEIDFGAYVVTPFPVEHRVAAYGYLFAENDRPGQFDVETARSLGLNPGPDFGRLQNGETIDGIEPSQVIGAPRPGRRIVFSGDTGPCQPTEVFADHADLLIHEATFLDQDIARARATGHSTATEAARVAETAMVKLLALIHLSTRYFSRDVAQEAKNVFSNTVVVRDFDLIELPFPERGQPRLAKQQQD